MWGSGCRTGTCQAQAMCPSSSLTGLGQGSVHSMCDLRATRLTAPASIDARAMLLNLWVSHQVFTAHFTTVAELQL